MSRTTSSLNQTLRDLAVEHTESLKQQLGDSPWAVALYGSVARREAAPASDDEMARAFLAQAEEILRWQPAFPLACSNRARVRCGWISTPG